MKKNKNLFVLAGILFLFFAMAGCYYDEVLPEPVVDDGEEISFTGKIIPIFNQSCNAVGCHNTGGIAPDLTADKAFTALSSGGYLDIGNPENSELYQWLRGNRSTPMPLTGPDASINSAVLAWISQGAPNN